MEITRTGGHATSDVIETARTGGHDTSDVMEILRTGGHGTSDALEIARTGGHATADAMEIGVSAGRPFSISWILGGKNSSFPHGSGYGIKIGLNLGRAHTDPGKK